MSGEIVKTKICSVCHEEKPIREFYMHSGCRDGHIGQCNNCVKLWKNKYREKNRGKYREWQKEWMAKNPEKRKQVCHNYYISHIERVLQKRKVYIKKNKDYFAAYARIRAVGLSKKKITNEIFEAIKTHVALCRAIKQKKEALNG